jgi:hypothetical protein
MIQEESGLIGPLFSFGSPPPSNFPTAPAATIAIASR